MASENILKNLLGSTLLKKVNESVTEIETSSLNKEGVIALYFSAHWCPPCCAFTPVLSNWYNKLTGDKLKGKLEVIFLSSDQSEEEFNNYYVTMPFCALPFSDREKKARVIL